METPAADTKQWRRELDETLRKLKGSERKSHERSLAITKIQEAVMWLGMDLKDIGKTPKPYPHNYGPASPVIEPTADGLKL